MSDGPILVYRLDSEDGTHRVDVQCMSNSMYRFVEMTEEAGDEYTKGPYMAFTHFSGLYDSAEAAERDARRILPWLRDRVSN